MDDNANGKFKKNRLVLAVLAFIALSQEGIFY